MKLVRERHMTKHRAQQINNLVQGILSARRPLS